jgi:HEPN domain-containing protein
MATSKAVIAVIREWLIKADHDLLTAAHTLKLGAECPTDTVCFHAQQSVEKHIKALLILRAIPFPKTHEIGLLRGLLPAKLRPKVDTKVEDRLTQFATVMRYPGTVRKSRLPKRASQWPSLGEFAEKCENTCQRRHSRAGENDARSWKVAL